MAGYNCTLYLCALLLIHVNICADANVHAHASLCACIPSCNCDQLWATVHAQTHALVRMSSWCRKVSDHHDRQSAVITAWAHTTWETAVITACFTMIDHDDRNFYVCVHACVCTRAWTLVYTWTSKYKHGDHHAHTCATLCADMHIQLANQQLWLLVSPRSIMMIENFMHAYMCACGCVWTLAYTWTSEYKHGDQHSHPYAHLHPSMHIQPAKQQL